MWLKKKSSKDIFLSIVIANYNKEKYLEKCLHSLLEQKTVCKYEIVVIDDGSSDNSVKILNEIVMDESHKTVVRFLKRSHKGKVNAFNHGVSIAKGEFIKLFGSDDIANSDMISKICHQVNSSKILIHDCAICDINGIVTKSHFLRLKSETTKFKTKDIIRGKSYPSGNYVFPRSIANRIFPIDERSTYEDWYISFIISLEKYCVKIIPDSLFGYRQVNNSAWGGVDNYSLDVIKYRASRDIKMLDIFSENVCSLRLKEIREKKKFLNELVDFKFTKITKSNLFLGDKLLLMLKVIIYSFDSRLICCLMKIKKKFTNY
jgi:glycosyltransferase involved in cell wall biosynthesis